MIAVRRCLLATLVAGLLAGSLSQPAGATTSSGLSTLRQRLQTAVSSSTASTQAAAVDISGVGQVYRSRGTTPVAPASTEKLFTAFAALHYLGPNDTFTTRVLSSGAQVGATLPGNLYVVAAGDWTLLKADLDNLAATLAARGVRTVLGRLYVDDNRYDHATRGPGWKPEFMPGDVGPLSAFAVDSNAWRTDSGYLADPAMANLGLFRTLLARHGISVAGLGRAVAPAGAAVVASHTSRALATMLVHVLKESDNFAAELLLKELGKVRHNKGSTQVGAQSAREVLQAMGVTVGTIADGSGLSNLNRQTAAGEVSLLTVAERTGVYHALRVALPISCLDGTLRKRMCNTAASGLVAAKTGTLDVVHALAGWTTTKDGRVVRFAFLLQGFSSGSKADRAIDAACVAMVLADLSA